MGRPANKPEHVWRYIEKRGADECWPWMAARQNGYGIFSMRHENFRAGRIICWLRDPESIDLRAENIAGDRRIVIHSCDNPACCNPAHLSVGTHRENTQDMIKKGRRADLRGVNGGRAKLSADQVLRIREARLFGASQKDLASIHSISVTSVSALLNGETYGVH